MPSSRSNILNYTTDVKAGRTVGEIVDLLVAKKAMAVRMDYDGGRVSAVSFVMKVGDNPITFRLTPNIAGVALKLPNQKDLDRAERVAWRIMLRWTEAQMAMIESNQAELGQVFMPYAVDANGETMWRAFQLAGGQLALGSGK